MPVITRCPSAAGFGAGQKIEIETDQNRGFFFKTQPKPTDLGQCEIVTTLISSATSKVIAEIIS